MRSLFLSTLDIDIAVLKRLVSLWHQVLPNSDENLQHRIRAVVRLTEEEEEVVVVVVVNIDGWGQKSSGEWSIYPDTLTSCVLHHAWLACKGPKLQPLCSPHLLMFEETGRYPCKCHDQVDGL